MACVLRHNLAWPEYPQKAGERLTHQSAKEALK